MTTKDNGRGAGYAPAAKERLHRQYTESPADRLLSRLEKVRQSGPGRWMAKCPAHKDRTASLSIREADDGRVLINPFCGCDPSDVLAAIGLTFADLFPPREPPAGGSVSRVPTILWRDCIEAIRDTLTALCVAADDIADGRPLTEADRGFIRDRASRVRDLLDLIGGGRHHG